MGRETEAKRFDTGVAAAEVRKGVSSQEPGDGREEKTRDLLLTPVASRPRRQIAQPRRRTIHPRNL